MENSIKNEFLRYMHANLEKFKKSYYEEEFLRNLLNYDLYKILSSEIKSNEHTNFHEVLSLHSERVLTMAQLTSQNENEVIKALKKIRFNKIYASLVKLDSFKRYINFLYKNTNNINIIATIDKYFDIENL